MRRTPGIRRPTRASPARLGAALGAAVLVAALTMAASTGAAGAASPGRIGMTDPTSGHPYRHGAVPRLVGGPVGSHAASLEAPGSMRGNAPGNPTGGKLRYGAGPVVTGQPRVYLVFWGSSWGTPTPGSGGYQYFPGDPAGEAPYLQEFFSGLGGGGEDWSATATQYCQGVAALATTCPASAAHNAFPAPGVLAGVWGDLSYSPPLGSPGDSSTTAIPGVLIAEEAQAAAAHFNDFGAGAQFVILAPSGANPDGWLGVHGFCAYHDDSSDWGLGGADVAYTNMPYQPDAGGSCGQNWVNAGSQGTLDGVSMTEGHEYYETLTDPFPISGWTDVHGNEIADKCVWLNAGIPGAATDLVLPTGSFAVQGMWANDANKGRGGCVVDHAVVTLVNPGKRQATVAGTAVNLAIPATDVFPGSVLSFAAAGLPPGLSIDPVTGIVSGVPTTPGHFAVTVAAGDGVYNASPITIAWTVRKPPRV